MISNDNKQRLNSRLPSPRLPRHIKSKSCKNVRYLSSGSLKSISRTKSLRTTSSITGSSISSTIPPYRISNSSLTTNEIASDEVLSDCTSVKDGKTYKKMIQTSTNKDSSARQRQNNNNNNNNNKQNSAANNSQNENNGNGNYQSGSNSSSGSNGSGSGGRKPPNDDDEKDKKNNYKNVNAKNNEEQNDTDEDEDKDDEKQVKFVNFSELTSEINIPFRPLDAAQKTISLNEYPFGYSPIKLERVQGMIKISKNLTQTVIPNMVNENIPNVYAFMDKMTAIAIRHQLCYDNGKIRIFNYGFHNKLGDSLYFVIDKIDSRKNTGFCWQMKDELFTKNELLNQYMYELCENELPESCTDLITSMVNVSKMESKLQNAAAFCSNIVFKTKWCKLYVFSMKNNKKYHKQRRTFSIIKTDFISIVQDQIYKEECPVVIPIVMFSNSGYRIEYIHIIKLEENINIGISYMYNKHCRYGIKVTGIHLHKESIMKQHEIAMSTNHNSNCHCLDEFKSDIDELRIGNPDDDINRCKAARHELKMKIKDLEESKMMNECLINENKDLQYDIRQFKDTMPRIQSHLNQEIANNKRNNITIVQLKGIIQQFQNQNKQLNDVIIYYRQLLLNNVNSPSISNSPSINRSIRGVSNASTPYSVSYSNRSTRGVSNASSYSITPQSVPVLTCNSSYSSFGAAVNNLKVPIITDVFSN